MSLKILMECNKSVILVQFRRITFFQWILYLQSKKEKFKLIRVHYFTMHKTTKSIWALKKILLRFFPISIFMKTRFLFIILIIECQFKKRKKI